MEWAPADKQHIDTLMARFVLQPQRFDVVVATNLFGNIMRRAPKDSVAVHG